MPTNIETLIPPVPNGAGFLTLAGDLTTTGAFGITLTATGATALTLPTSGTLATVGGNLGTPSAAVLTNATGLPIASGVSGLAANVATFLAAPSSANLLAALTSKTGSGSAVFATAPAIAGGSHTALTSLGIRNAGTGAFDVTIAHNSTLTSARTLLFNLADGSRSINLSGDLTLGATFQTTGAFATVLTVTAPTSITLPTSGLLAVVSGALGTPSSVSLVNATGLPVASGISGLGSGVATFLATPNSTNLRAAVSDETGSGSLVFATAPAIVGGSHTELTELSLRSSTALFDLTLLTDETLTADRLLYFNLGNQNRRLTLTGNPNLSGFTATGTGTLALGANTLTVNNTITLASDGVGTRTLNIASGGTLGSNAFNSTAFLTGTGGALTTNALVLGAGAVDTKVVSGITTDGVSKLNLGTAGTSVGAVVFSNATSGSVTLQPAAGALGSITAFLPAVSGTIAFVSSNLGTPTALVLTNATGLPVGTGISGLGTGVATALAVNANAAGGVATTDGAATLTNKTVESATFTNGYTEESVTANTGTAYTVDLANGSIFYLTLTGNCVFTFPAVVAGKSFTLFLIQDANGSRSVTWPSSVASPGGVAPTITATSGRADKIVFTAAGTKWALSVAGQDYVL